MKGDTEGVLHAKVLKDYQYKHVKWHLLDEFLQQIRDMLKIKYNVVSKIDQEQITSLTHRNSETIWKITFQKNGKLYYLCNDAKGFSVGLVKPNIEKTNEDYKFLGLGGNNQYFSYFDFTNDKVFKYLTDTVKREELILDIMKEVNSFI